MACKESICKNCFHSYVCEQFNENKDDNNEKCHFFNDHYVPRADVAPKSEVAIVSVQNAALIEANQNLRKQNTEYKIEIEAMRMAANSYKMHFEDLKTEVARKLLSDLKKAVHDKAVCSYGVGIDAYISIKTFDAVLQNFINKYRGDR